MLNWFSGGNILISGATGFVGLAVIERLLYSYPQVGTIIILARGRGNQSAQDRIGELLQTSPAFSRLRERHGEEFNVFIRQKIRVISANLGQPRHGLAMAEYKKLTSQVSHIINCAATVQFAERLDYALEANVKNPIELLNLAKHAGNIPFAHVSSCYVCGPKSGQISEELHHFEQAPAPEDLFDGMKQAVNSILLRQADAAENDPKTGRELIKVGQQLAQKNGFPNIYCLTKWLAECLIFSRRQAVPLTIIRPAIIEASLQAPMPGWKLGFKTLDPVMVAYMWGHIQEFPGAEECYADLVPVDMVVNCLLTALVQTNEKPAIYHIASSNRNPLTFGELTRHLHDGINRHHGAALEKYISQFRWMSMDRFREVCRLRKGVCPPMESVCRRQMLKYAELYANFTFTQRQFNDANTQLLFRNLSSGAPRELRFDTAAINWSAYAADELPRRFLQDQSAAARSAKTTEDFMPDSNSQLPNVLPVVADAKSVPISQRMVIA